MIILNEAKIHEPNKENKSIPSIFELAKSIDFNDFKCKIKNKEKADKKDGVKTS